MRSHPDEITTELCQYWRLCPGCLRVGTHERCTKCDFDTSASERMRGLMVSLIGGLRDHKFLGLEAPIKGWCPWCGYGNLDHDFHSPECALEISVILWEDGLLGSEQIMSILSELSLEDPYSD